jgi:PAS domain S-box-containing protein
MVAFPATTPELSTTLQRILRLAQQAIPFDRGAIHLIHDGALWVQAVYTTPGVQVDPNLVGQRIDLGQGFCGHVATTGQSFLSPVVAEETRIRPARYTGANLLIQSFLGLPLCWEGEVMGVLEMDSHTPRFFQPQHVELAAVVADQAALTIFNARLAAERQQWAMRQQALLHSVEAMNSSLDLSELLQRIIAHASAIAEGEAVLGILDGPVLYFDPTPDLPLASPGSRSYHDWPDGELYNPLRAQTAQPLSALPPELRDHFADPGPALALPILDVQQGPLGVLVIARPAGAATFSDEEVQLLNALAHQAALAISKARMLQREQEERRVNEVLRQIAEALSGSLDLDSVANVVLARLGELLPFDCATLGLLEGIHLRFIAGRGALNLPPGEVVPLDDLLLSATVIRKRKPLRLDDATQGEYHRAARFSPNLSWLGVPLIANDEVIGIISLDKAEAAAYDEHDVQRLQIFASQVAITIENTRLLQQARRRQAELQALTDYNNLLIETSPVGIAVVDPEGRFVRANPAFRNIVTTRGQEIAGADVTEVLSGPEQAELRDLIASTLQSQAPTRIEDFKFPNQDGGPCWLDLALNPLRGPDGSVTRLMMTVTDITQRKQMEEDLRKRNLRIEQQLNQHRALYEIGAQINAVLNVQEVLQSLITSVRAIFAVDGLSLMMPDERTGTFETTSTVGLSEAFLESEKAHFRESAGGLAIERQIPVLVQDVAASERMSSLREAARQESIHTALYLPLVFREEVIGLMALYHRAPRQYTVEEMEWLATFANQATTATKNAQFHASIVESRSNLHAILQSMTDGVLATDSQGYITYINQPLFDLLGMPKDDAWVGRSAEGLWAHLQRTFPALPSFDRLGRSEDVVRTEIHARGGEDTWGREIQLVYSPIVDEGGGTVGRLLLLHDITQLRAGERTKDELISIISHELRTPMTSILGYSKLLVDRPDADLERRARWAELILDKSRLLTQLVNEVLDLSRLNMQRLDLHLEPTDLAALAHRVADELRVTTTRHIIRVEADENLPPVPADLHRMDQMLTNLVTNAIKYSPDGGEITLSVARDDTWLTLSVSDEGMGIAPEHHERIFEPFFRVDHSTTRNVYGTGLGLSLVRGIAEAHGGDVSIQSAVGEGTTFRVRLPLRAPQQAVTGDH